MTKNNKIPYGVTCHYERIDSNWFVVWSSDFPGDEPGKAIVEWPESMYLELGYQQRKSEEK
jgi:hypothetical protein